MNTLIITMSTAITRLTGTVFVITQIFPGQPSSIPPLFNRPDVLTSSKDQAYLFAAMFSTNSTLNDTLYSIPNFIIANKTGSLPYANSICKLDVAKAQILTVFHLLSYRCVLQSCLLFLLSCTTNACLSLVFHVVGYFPLLYLLTKMEKDLILVWSHQPSSYYE